MKTMDLKKKRTLLIIVGAILILLIIGISYALINKVFEGTNTNRITSGTIRFVYNEPTSNITLTDAVGVVDNEALTSEDYFEFNVQASTTGKTKVGYIIYLTPDTTNTIANDAIKVGLTSVNGTTTAVADEVLLSKDILSNYITLNTSTLTYDATANNYIINESMLDFTTNQAQQTNYYRLRLWLDYDYFNNNLIENADTDTIHEINATGGTFKLKVNVYALDEKQLNINPLCSFNGPNPSTIATTETAIYELTCKSANGFNDSDITASDFNITGDISITNIVKTEVVKGYKYTLTVTGGPTEGNATLQLKAGSISDSYSSTNALSSVSNAITILNTAIYTYDYNGTTGSDGSVQTFTAPATGYYKLEAWGAQGGSYTTTYYGGYGGYSEGLIKLNKNNILYVYVAGSPTDSVVVNQSIVGGYNGGGASTARSDCINNAGGGATHIATTTGLLATLSSSASSVLMVAGGGGGNNYYNTARYGIGGAGGGYIGIAGNYATASNCEGYGYGGTQTSGGSYYVLTGHYYASSIAIPVAGFGYGSAADATIGGAGGGGGYYGGRGFSCVGGAGGGSGYIGNSLLVSSSTLTKHMYTYCSESDCTAYQSTATGTYTNTGTNVSATATSDYAKSGNGYAKITWIGNTLN